MLAGRPAAWAQSLAIPSRVTARSLTMLKMLPLAASGFSTARVSIEDKSLAWVMLLSCNPEPGIGTGLSRTIPAIMTVYSVQFIYLFFSFYKEKSRCWSMADFKKCVLTVKKPLLTVFVVARPNNVLWSERCPTSKSFFKVFLHNNMTSISFNNILLHSACYFNFMQLHCHNGFTNTDDDDEYKNIQHTPSTCGGSSVGL